MDKATKAYDLEDRCFTLSERVILLVKNINISPINKSVIEQLVRSSSSIGANYCEANEGESKKDFVHKVKIAKKETKETKYWLRLLAKCEPSYTEELKILWKETHELLLIFSKIVISSKLIK